VGDSVPSWPDPSHVNGYLLCGTPRTGSTLLCGLLRSTNLAGRAASYFRLPDEQAWANRWRLPRDADGAFNYGDYVRAAVATGTQPERSLWGQGHVGNCR
jgi:trehalose 2-sulfotransferase